MKSAPLVIAATVSAVLAAGCGKDAGRTPERRASLSPSAATRDSATVPTAAALCMFGMHVTCMRDTTFAHEVDFDPGLIVEANWLWFGTRGDSVEVVTDEDSTMYGAAETTISTDFGQEQDANHNTASYVRRRLPRGGIFAISVMSDPGVSDS